MDGESNSIANQKKILLKYAKDNGFPNPLFFIDDGVSGVTFAEAVSYTHLLLNIKDGNSRQGREE